MNSPNKLFLYIFDSFSRVIEKATIPVIKTFRSKQNSRGLSIKEPSYTLNNRHRHDSNNYWGIYNWHRVIKAFIHIYRNHNTDLGKTFGHNNLKTSSWWLVLRRNDTLWLRLYRCQNRWLVILSGTVSKSLVVSWLSLELRELIHLITVELVYNG